MRLRRFATAFVVVGIGTLAASSGRAATTANDPCRIFDGNSAPASQDEKESCYRQAYTNNEYGKLVDYIESLSARSAAEIFYLGGAHFGLANRSGVPSIQCLHAELANGWFEEFFDRVEDLSKEKAGFGSEGDLQNIASARRMIDALKKMGPCAEAPRSDASLRSHGARYARRRVRDIFLGRGDANSLLPQGTNGATSLDELNAGVEALVTKASQVESRYRLIGSEVRTGGAALEEMATFANGKLVSALGVSGEVVHVEAPSGAPIVSAGAGVSEAIRRVLEKKDATAEVSQSVSRANALCASIIGSSIDGIHEQKAKIVGDMRELTATIGTDAARWNGLPARAGMKGALAIAGGPATASPLTESQRAVTQLFFAKLGPRCPQNTAQPSSWFCQGRP